MWNQTEENDNNLNDSKVYTLSAKGEKVCLKMINGAAPSDIGISLTEASLFLWLFSKKCKRRLERNWFLDDELRGELVRLIGKAGILGEMYGEAAVLSGETPK